jgi:hypothetical protein
MKKSKQSKSTKISAELLKKIKKLKSDEIYPTSVISVGIDKDRVYISRFADCGEIIKVKRGFFYKPSNKTIYKKSNKTIPLNKSIFNNDMFWSVKDGFEVNADELIRVYLKNYSEEDLMALYTLFGYKRLLSECLVIYKKRTDENYKRIRKILEKLDQWRINDK